MIVLEPFGIPRLILLLLAVASGAGAAHLLWDGAGLTEGMRVAFTLSVVGLGAWALDGAQRRYEIRSQVIRVRVLFAWWRTYRIPGDVSIRTDRFGRMILVEPEGRTILSFPRGYNRLGELEKRFWHLRVFRDGVS